MSTTHPDLGHVADLLSRTPSVLRTLLAGLPEAWLDGREGPGSWSSREVVGHLIHGEETDWIPRAEQILASGTERPFEPFDRFAMLSAGAEQDLGALLAKFESLRAANLARLEELALTPAHLTREGVHPEFGRVTLGQLLATWVVHDLSHLAQIQRVLAKQYEEEVGPWSRYLPLLTDRARA